MLDIVIELTERRGFRPLILLSRLDGSYFLAAKDLDATVEYANLSTGEDSEPLEAYRVVDLDGDGINELVFSHLLLGRTLKSNVVLRLAADGRDLEVWRSAPLNAKSGE